MRGGGTGPARARVKVPMARSPRARRAARAWVRVADVAVMVAVPPLGDGAVHLRVAHGVDGAQDEEHDGVAGEQRRVKGKEYKVLLVVGTDAGRREVASGEGRRESEKGGLVSRRCESAGRREPESAAEE